MLPRWHIFWGAVLTAVLFFFIPDVGTLNLILVFLSSFLIDFDHYLNGVWKGKAWSLRKNFEYHKEIGKNEKKDLNKGIKRKGDFHLFHTVEFHLLVGLLGVLWIEFYYIFIGMVFHSLLDVIYLVKFGRMHRREYFFFNWLVRKI